MKLISSTISFALLVSTVAASPMLSKRAASCPANVLSCTSAAQSAGACCSPTYGLLVLVQQWVVGYGPSDAFTLHGLWPDTCSGGQGPSSGCDSSRSYDNLGSILESTDPQLYKDASTYWPSYKDDNSAFWTHEWVKHGTCVSTLKPSCNPNAKKYQDVTDYFQTALDLRAKYDIHGALKGAGISPGGSFSSASMESAIEKAFGVQVQVNCDEGGLSEVWMFFNVKGANTYVPVDAPRGGSCNGAVAYPDKGASTGKTNSPTMTGTAVETPSPTSLGR